MNYSGGLVELSKNTVRIAISKAFNQNLQCNCVEILEHESYKSNLSKKAEPSSITPIAFTYHLKNQPPDSHRKAVDWFPCDKCPPNRP